MTETYCWIADFDPSEIENSWVLVLGGITREGNRRARRAVRAATDHGFAALWFDGFEETYEANPGERVPVGDLRLGCKVYVAGYASNELNLASNKITSVVPGMVAWPAKVITKVGSDRGTVARVAEWFRRTARKLRRGPLRKLSQALRGYMNWRILRGHLKQLRTVGGLQAVIYCDDFAIPSAWHAARYWPAVPVAMEFTPTEFDPT